MVAETHTQNRWGNQFKMEFLVEFFEKFNEISFGGIVEFSVQNFSSDFPLAQNTADKLQNVLETLDAYQSYVV